MDSAEFFRVMIKSKILNDSDMRIGLRWGLMLLLVAAAVFLRAVLFGEQYATPLEAFAWYPTVIIGGLLPVISLVKKFFSDWGDFEPKVLPIGMILALVLGFFVSLLPFWGRIAAGMPLSLTQIVTYFLTLGVYPLQAGPDGFLRGIAWACAIILAVFLYKEKKDLFRSIFLGILIWLTITVVFISPSIILILTMIFHSLPFSVSGAEMVSEFTRLNLFSYWGDGQLLRWFTGFGGQATNALLLYTASWIYILIGVFWVIANFNLIKSTLFGFKAFWVIPAISVLLFGLLAGASHQTWTGLDAAAWGVFILVVFFSWLYHKIYLLEMLAPEVPISVLWILGLMLLGWPVLLGGLLVLCGILCGNQIKMYGFMPRWQWTANVFLPFAVVMLFVLFMRRGVALDPVMLRIVLAFGLFALLAEFVEFAKKVNLSNLWIMGGWILVAGLLWIVTGVFSPVAIMLLVGVFMWLLWKKIIQYSWNPAILVWSMAIVVLLMVIWLPRIAHPELIPR